MKKLSFIFVLLFGLNSLFAQTGVQINFDQLQKKVEKSNADIENPKKNIKESTWIDRAVLMMEIYDSQLLNSRLGMSVPEFTLVAGKPKNRIQEEQEGNLVEKFVMERAIFYFINNVLEKWEVLNPVVENPLKLANESLAKAIEIDVKGKKTKNIKENLERLKGLYIADGSNCYAMKKYDCAYLNFSDAIKVGEMPILGHKDTAVFYYTGLSAQLAGKNLEAIDYYKKAIDLGFSSDGNAYSNIDEAFRANGDPESGLPFLEVGFTKYPKNQSILIALINYYLNKNEDPAKVITYIEKAIQDDPGNFSLYHAKGAVYDKLNDFDNAITAYTKATELNPKFFDSYFNIGALYYNKGIKFLEEANKIPPRETDKYDAMITKANEEFKKSLPFMLKAYEIKADDKNTVETLKNIYFRYRNESKEMNDKYLEFQEKAQNL